VIHLYKTVKLNVQRVVRDEAFAADMVSRLGEVWARVLAYRGDRRLYDAEVSSGAARRQRAPSRYAFIDVD